MFSLQAADRLLAACAERAPGRDALGDIVLLNIGLLLINESRHALAYEIVKVAAKVEGCSGAAAIPLSQSRGEIDPRATRIIDQGLALDRPMQAGAVLRGTIQASLRYGPPGRLREALDLDFAVSFKALSAREIAVFRWNAV